MVISCISGCLHNTTFKWSLWNRNQWPRQAAESATGHNARLSPWQTYSSRNCCCEVSGQVMDKWPCMCFLTLLCRFYQQNVWLVLQLFFFPILFVHLVSGKNNKRTTCLWVTTPTCIHLRLHWHKLSIMFSSIPWGILCLPRLGVTVWGKGNDFWAAAENNAIAKYKQVKTQLKWVVL